MHGLNWVRNNFLLQFGESPLFLASFNGQLKCIELLIEAGVNINASKDVSRMLHLETIQLLVFQLTRTICSVIKIIQDGSTALYVAAERGHLKVVQLLIAAKSQVDSQTKVSIKNNYKYRHVGYFTWNILYMCIEWSHSTTYSLSRGQFEDSRNLDRSQRQCQCTRQ